MLLDDAVFAAMIDVDGAFAILAVIWRTDDKVCTEMYVFTTPKTLTVDAVMV